MTTGEIKAILLKIFILAFLLSNIENTAATLMVNKQILYFRHRSVVSLIFS